MTYRSVIFKICNHGYTSFSFHELFVVIHEIFFLFHVKHVFSGFMATFSSP